MTQEQAIRKTRRAVGLPKFERECRCTMFGSREMKAHKVPGTREAGQYAMLRYRMDDLVKEYIK